MEKSKSKRDTSIVCDNRFSYMEYMKITDNYLKKDPRELNFQNRLIVCMLEKLLIDTDIEVVDTSTLYFRGKKNSKNLDNSQFTGRNSNGKHYAPPDLLLARNWNHDNKHNKVDYIAAIEIKSPIGNEHIYGKKFEKYPSRVEKEIRAHLSVHTKVILTDCYRWQFFNNKDGFVDTPPIDLVDESKQWKFCVEKLDEFISDKFDIKDNTKMGDPEEWEQLQNEILSFIRM